MTSPRQKEIKKAMNIRTFIWVLAFLCFWSPVLYFWAWMLWPTDQVIVLSLGFGFSGLCLLYPFWSKYGKKLDRLLKYTVLFGPFFEAMIEDMEANDEEKGDSWLAMHIEDLIKLQGRKWRELQTPGLDALIKHRQHPKLANYCAMIYLLERYAIEETEP